MKKKGAASAHNLPLNLYWWEASVSFDICVVGENYVILLGQVVRKPVNTNQGLKANQGNNFSSMKMLSSITFCVVWEYLCSKLENKKYKPNTWLKSYKNEIKILANPGLA